MREIQLKIEKLIHGGQALGYAEKKTCFVWNALPGEEVRAWVLREKERTLEAHAHQILTPSPERLAPAESHYLACAPWQILNWDAENRWKNLIAHETYTRLGKLKELVIPAISAHADRQLGYRCKIEYNFLSRQETGKLPSAAFGIHQRGTHDLHPITECALAQPALNTCAASVLSWLNENRFAPENLSRLVVKQGSEGSPLAALYLHKPAPLPPNATLANTAGLSVFLESREAATRPARILGQNGSDYVTTTLLETPLHHGPQCFFQINPPIFESALRHMAHFLSSEDNVVDYYAGVGAISLPLADRFHSATLIESHTESAAFAKKNIDRLNLDRCRLFNARAEHASRWIEHDKILILDPPRSGLADPLIKTILTTRPIRLIYLSCDIATHARDLARLAHGFILKDLQLYNFFPRTPHIEALAILDRK